MSTYVRLTLIGLYNHDETLFDKLTLPEAYDRQTFIDTVLLDQGEKCVAYPEPDFFKYAVGIWSRKWAESLERIALALESEYNPIHNYDRYEEWTEKEKGNYTNHLGRGGQDTTTNTGTVTTKETGKDTETTTNMETERSVSAFNESAYQPDEKSVVNGKVTREPDTTQTVTPNTTEVTAHNTSEDGTGNDNRDKEHKAHLFGNIGITTSQKMVEDETNLRLNYNMYAIAATLFADDLLLMLY